MRSGLTSSAVRRAVVVVFLAISAFSAPACRGGGGDGGDNSNGGGDTPTVPVIPGAGSRPTPAPTATAVSATATSTRPAATPAQTLPTPVLPGFPTIPLPLTSPEREIVDLINRNGPAYSAALVQLNEALLAGVFTGEALAVYTEEVRQERVKATRSQNALLSIELTQLQRSDGTATVSTKEQWRFQVGNTCTVFSYDEFYQVALLNGGWMIAKNQFVQTASRPC